MSKEDMKRFTDLVSRDEALARQVPEAGTDVDRVIRLGRENSCELTAEDLKAVEVETEEQLGVGLLSFLDKVSKDENLAVKLKEAATDVDEIIRLGKDNGCEFTEKNLVALRDMTGKSDEELSDKDLEDVAGGFVFMLVLAGLAAGGAALAVGAAVGMTYALGGLQPNPGKQ